ncbi:MAG: DNA mismatch repair endonuclease MutL [Promethearchaeota archaeon]
MNRKKIQKIINANKIAAGEVVDRPANIVKELVENSIDAGASEIKILVNKAGKLLIQVIDNGIGIPPDEMEIAFESHTSSKIRSIEDLNVLSTLGFRGEALHSIAVVSQVEIISRTSERELGYQLIIEGGKLIDKKEVSCPVGTNIKVKNIFFNLPARQKFLKSDTTELGHISDIIQRYSLAYPHIHIIYQHNDLNLLNCPTSNDLKTTIFHIYGKKVAKYMEPIDYSEDNISFKIKGLLGHPEISKKNRNFSSLFINQRYIISDILFRAIKEAYKGTLMINKHPFFVLNLELDPSVVDFNVHPKKLQVRFEKEDYIYNKVYNIIRSQVEEKFILKEEKYISTEINDFISTKKVISTKIEKPIKEIRERNSIKAIIIENKDSLKDFVDDTIQLRLTDHDINKNIDSSQDSETYLKEKYIIAKNFPKLKFISNTGQLSNKTYVVLEGINENNERGIYILDQHAASERINKEFFLKACEESKNNCQRLISPLKIDVLPSEKSFIEENIYEIRKLGFNFENFGGNTFILREIPTIMDKTPNINILHDIISDITRIGKDKSFSQVKEEIINYLACHKSIRGGDDLSLKNIRNLLIDLSNCENPFYCAHGRPTLKFISFKELDKLFKRIT